MESMPDNCTTIYKASLAAYVSACARFDCGRFVRFWVNNRATCIILACSSCREERSTDKQSTEIGILTSFSLVLFRSTVTSVTSNSSCYFISSSIHIKLQLCSSFERTYLNNSWTNNFSPTINSGDIRPFFRGRVCSVLELNRVADQHDEELRESA